MLLSMELLVYVIRNGAAYNPMHEHRQPLREVIIVENVGRIVKHVNVLASTKRVVTHQMLSKIMPSAMNARPPHSPQDF